MKRSISMSLAGVAAATTLVAGVGTTAAFNDVEASDGNSVESGTLDLAVNETCDSAAPGYSNGTVHVLLDSTNAYPGQVLAKGDLCIQNLGSLIGDLSVALPDDGAIDKDVTCTEPESKSGADAAGEGCTADGELDNHVTLELAIDKNCNEGNIATKTGGVEIFTELAPVLEAGQMVCVTYTYTFNEDATNEAQSDLLGFDLDFKLDQSSKNVPA